MWAVLAENYEAPSRFAVTVIEVKDLVRENVKAFQAMKPLPSSTVLGLFTDEIEARDVARRVQDIRDSRAGIQDKLLRPPSEE
ncbi:hypothetical protein A2G96_07840 [Cupriavidus nantongensis]|uniref:Uncharacterized protein n=1 Tax=Cupriavidus nantongensis TaxID=1796606 RepID=A0A142JHU0_9BURK|nr:hypothetical protein A2G96_07840 [Cupriavidus nantongensis]